jgi:hypothetical protein
VSVCLSAGAPAASVRPPWTRRVRNLDLTDSLPHATQPTYKAARGSIDVTRESFIPESSTRRSTRITCAPPSTLFLAASLTPDHWQAAGPRPSRNQILVQSICTNVRRPVNRIKCFYN